MYLYIQSISILKYSNIKLYILRHLDQKAKNYSFDKIILNLNVELRRYRERRIPTQCDPGG
jgi:hypothetical protein